MSIPPLHNLRPLIWGRFAHGVGLATRSPQRCHALVAAWGVGVAATGLDGLARLGRCCISFLRPLVSHKGWWCWPHKLDHGCGRVVATSCIHRRVALRRSSGGALMPRCCLGIKTVLIARVKCRLGIFVINLVVKKMPPRHICDQFSCQKNVVVTFGLCACSIFFIKITFSNLR